MKYLLWQNNGSDGWSMERFDTLGGALTADRHSSTWMITPEELSFDNIKMQ